MTSVLIVGATGLVGGHALAMLLADTRVDRVVAPTRKALPANAKLLNPVIDFSRLPGSEEWWAVDGVVCALGTTRAKAGSAEAFRAVDLHLPLAIARLARSRGAVRFALTSAMGANARSALLYPRTKGELERALIDLHFPSLTIVRPGLLGGKRAEFRAGERIAEMVLRAAGPILPRRYRISPADVVARVLVDAAIAAPPGTHLIESDRLSSLQPA